MNTATIMQLLRTHKNIHLISNPMQPHLDITSNGKVLCSCDNIVASTSKGCVVCDIRLTSNNKYVMEWGSYNGTQLLIITTQDNIDYTAPHRSKGLYWCGLCGWVSGWEHTHQKGTVCCECWGSVSTCHSLDIVEAPEWARDKKAFMQLASKNEVYLLADMIWEDSNRSVELFTNRMRCLMSWYYV